MKSSTESATQTGEISTIREQIVTRIEPTDMKTVETVPYQGQTPYRQKAHRLAHSKGSIPRLSRAYLFNLNSA
jgi:hypothetical protein